MLLFKKNQPQKTTGPAEPTLKSQFTRVTPHVDLETTGLIIGLVTAWVGAHEVASFSEVSAIVGEQSTEGDEGFLTACIG